MKTIKYINYIVFAVQIVLMILAFDLGGIYLLLFLLFNIIWAIWYAYNNWTMISGVSDYLLSKATGETFMNGKAIEVKTNGTKRRKTKTRTRKVSK